MHSAADTGQELEVRIAEEDVDSLVVVAELDTRAVEEEVGSQAAGVELDSQVDECVDNQAAEEELDNLGHHIVEDQLVVGTGFEGGLGSLDARIVAPGEQYKVEG